MARAMKKPRNRFYQIVSAWGACGSGLRYINGKTVDQAWEKCDNASFLLWWTRQLWQRSSAEKRAYYFGHSSKAWEVACVIGHVDETSSASQQVLCAALYEAPKFLKTQLRKSAQRWAKDQGLRVVRVGWKSAVGL